MIGRRSMSEAKSTRTGHCFCGAVELAVTLWPPDAVRVTRGMDKVGNYHKTDNSVRKWCTVCGGHLMTEHPQWKLIDVYAAIIPDVPFAPGVHVNYRDTVLPM